MLRVLSVLAALFCAIGTASAQGYTTGKYITLVAPFPAGSASDNLSRVLGKGLGELLGTSIVVENRPGAGGNIAADAVAKAAPDGHTVLVVGSNNAAAMSLYPNHSFDLVKDFSPVSLVAVSPTILIASPAFPADSVADLIRVAKQKPGVFRYGSAGNGSMPHLTMELFKARAGVDIVHVPYKGVPGALNDFLGGRIEMIFSTLSPAIPLIQSGKAKALGVSSTKRFPSVPKVPAVAEAVPDFELIAWWGLLVPAGTPERRIEQLHDAVVKFANAPDTRQRMMNMGFEMVTNTPEQFGTFIQSEIVKFAEVVKASGAKVD